MEEKDNIQEQLNNDEQKNTNPREGREFRPAPGRSPRPRIHTNTRPTSGSFDRPSFDRTSYDRPSYDRPSYDRPSYDRPAYSRRPASDDDRGFRPEGFGASLQANSQQRSYRPRTSYNNGGYNQQPRQGYQPRPRYGQDGEQGYQPRPRYNRNEGDGAQQSYQPRPRYGQSRPQQYDQQRPYNPRNAHGPRQNNNYGNRRQNNNRSYDPNAKYSLKKRIEYKEQHFDPNEPIRLNKFLANAGVCSRREADEFIQAGVVTVNGQVVTELGTKIMRTDEVHFHDQLVGLEKKVYVLLNKPKDYVTTSDDPQQRKTVMDLVKDACSERIYPVGRLDRNTTGVLLLTNDGDLASKLTHPKYLKKKIYHVFLDRNVTAHDMQQIAEGITLDDGEIRADDVQYASPTDKKQVGIEIHSGKNRIVRRIFESLGYKVTKLDRVQFAGLTKKNLRRGDWRYLTEEEVDRLRMGAYE